MKPVLSQYYTKIDVFEVSKMIKLPEKYSIHRAGIILLHDQRLIYTDISHWVLSSEDSSLKPQPNNLNTRYFINTISIHGQKLVLTLTHFLSVPSNIGYSAYL